ncbi:hypothetical protein EXW96_25475 [Paenibacillus sp. JMULE4]|uniref:hypothetical protein n=1 Tax=unclassified Paenibacillus TaxID=185978 RepID=UPI000722F991|nr:MULTISPECIES: hypothetical protein [Paenibacillaceae]ALS28867.1 hypothetical protein IJ21_34780 [Paenibacillus sp. 32O-W]NTZ20742.1 hypothetical protein [Paenibacillus sp. JMULE4]
MSDQCDIACHRLSFSEEEMSEYEQLRESIFKHLIKIDEQADGYSFIFPNAEGQLLQYLGKWIPFELKCCPFLKIAIAVNHDDNVRLELSGPMGIKDFLLHELQLHQNNF